MSLAAPLPTVAARTLAGRRSAGARCTGLRLQARSAPAHLKAQSSAGLAMADDNPLSNAPRRRTAAKAMAQPGNVPDEGLPRAEVRCRL
jgi:hypothetical protein